VRDYYRRRHELEGSHTKIFHDEGLPLEKLAQAKTDAHIHQFLQKDSELIRLLKRIKRLQLGLSVFSTSADAHVLPILEALGIRKYVDFTVTPSNDGILPKPSDTGYKLVESLSHCAGREILMVGDRENIDLKTAKARGWQTCLVFWETSGTPPYGQAIDHFVQGIHHLYERVLTQLLPAEP
ncbi:HAD family hydrolase, partial [Candidatus Woesearchaeota archaeon]|nr:HAD family hydrolase [Candidatus Woesearchaeota archaeon]